MLAALTKLIRNLVLLLLALLTLWLAGGYAYRHWKERQGWPGGFDPKTLPTPQPSLRIALLGRPAELPVKALSRLPSVSQLHIEFRHVKDANERFQMLAAGTVDLTIASLDELALAFPRFQPGYIIFPAADNRGNDGVVETEKNEGGLLGYMPGGTCEALARSVPGRQFQMLGGESPEKLLEWLKIGQVKAVAVSQPYLADAQSNGGKLLIDTNQRPTTEVWVASRRLLKNELQGRAQVGDLKVFAKAWFQFVDQLNSDPDLTLKAMASENDLTPERAQATLQGLNFLSLSALKARADRWPGEVTKKLETELTFWSLSGAPNQKGAKFEDALDPTVLNELLAGVEGNPVATATPDPGVPVNVTASPSPLATGTPSVHSGPPSVGSALGGDSARLGHSPGPALRDLNDKAWSTGVGGEVNTAVVASGGAVFFGSDDHFIYAFEDKTGTLKWKFNTGDQVRSTPAIAGDRVYCGSNDGRLYALDLKTGSKVWAYQAQGEVASSPLVENNRVYCASRDGTVFCLDAVKGSEVWTFRTTANITSSPALADETLVIGSFDGGIYGLNADSGKKIWVHKTRGVIQSTPTIIDGKVLVGSFDHNLYCLKLSSGQEIWKKSTGDEIATGVAVDQSIVCFGGRDTNIYGVDLGTGRERWKYPTRERVSSSPTIADGIVYIGSEDQRIYALNLDQGTLVFKFKVDGWVSTPVVVGQSVIFGSTDKNIYCLK